MITMLSNTPVAGTVQRLVTWAERLLDRPATALIGSNYANNVFDLPSGAFRALPQWQRYIADVVSASSCIIVHNVYDRELLEILFSAKPSSCAILFQVHSPPFEGPSFLYETLYDYPFNAVLVIGQGHGRFLHDAITVPNVIPDKSYPATVTRTDRVFVPHLRSTNFRWSSKVGDADLQTLRDACNDVGFQLVNVKDAFGRPSVTHGEIQLFLRSVSLAVDDLNSGLLHQTAFEAIKAGVVVFSGADPISRQEAMAALDAPPLPIVRVNDAEEAAALLRTHGFRQGLEARRAVLADYAETYLGEARIAQRYFSCLRDYLDVPGGLAHANA